MAQHWGRRGANVSENEGVRSECKKFGENSRQMAPVSTICDEYCRFIKERAKLVDNEFRQDMNSVFATATNMRKKKVNSDGSLP